MVGARSMWLGPDHPGLPNPHLVLTDLPAPPISAPRRQSITKIPNSMLSSLLLCGWREHTYSGEGSHDPSATVANMVE